jgi:hypothetical protein
VKYKRNTKFWSSECKAVLARALLSRDKIQPHVKFWSSDVCCRKDAIVLPPDDFILIQEIHILFIFASSKDKIFFIS